MELKRAERLALEEAHMAEQLAKQKKYGVLRIESAPEQAVSSRTVKRLWWSLPRRQPCLQRRPRVLKAAGAAPKAEAPKAEAEGADAAAGAAPAGEKKPA